MIDLLNNVETSESLEKLSGKQNLQSLTNVINILIDKIAELESRPVRDRGPKSERKMSDEDAFRIKFGDLKDVSHKQCAQMLNLSYGQIYSARGGYTFKDVKEDFEVSK